MVATILTYLIIFIQFDSTTVNQGNFGSARRIFDSETTDKVLKNNNELRLCYENIEKEIGCAPSLACKDE